MTDYYATLGVARTATQDEIKRAYRKMASQHHPDRGGDTARFQEIQAAYDTLSDENKRRAYDNPPQSRGFNFQDFGGHNMHGVNINDIFGQMFGGFQNFGQAGARRSVARMNLWVTLADVAQGGRRPVSVGSEAGTRTLDIEIPLGVNDGDSVHYGPIAPGGAELVITYRIHPNPAWTRSALNLHTDYTVTVWDLILGAEVQLRDLMGRQISFVIPAGTQPGTVLRLRGQGLRDRESRVGDIMVKIQARLPENIPPELTELIRQQRGQ